MENNILLEKLKIRKPPTEFQDVCLKTFCAARATLQLEDFNVEGQCAVRRGFHCESWLSFPPFQVCISIGQELSCKLVHAPLQNIHQIWQPNFIKWDNYSTTLITMAIYPFWGVQLAPKYDVSSFIPQLGRSALYLGRFTIMSKYHCSVAHITRNLI